MTVEELANKRYGGEFVFKQGGFTLNGNCLTINKGKNDLDSHTVESTKVMLNKLE
jgi:hypothetical protein